MEDNSTSTDPCSVLGLGYMKSTHRLITVTYETERRTHAQISCFPSQKCEW